MSGQGGPYEGREWESVVKPVIEKWGAFVSKYVRGDQHWEWTRDGIYPVFCFYWAIFVRTVGQWFAVTVLLALRMGSGHGPYDRCCFSLFVASGTVVVYHLSVSFCSS